MGRGLQIFGSSGWVWAAGSQGGQETEKRKRREPGRLVEPAGRAASGSQSPVGTAAASWPTRAVLIPPPLTLSGSLLLPREMSLGSPRRFSQPVSGYGQGAHCRTLKCGAPAGRLLLCARFPLFALLLRLLRPHQLQL
ncbi:hypothetical protein mRhiFer1_009937 [Rhinolophus ferrumequinum]|uniref:Uncharacterized protein n=1 Tax=Rhinolophus ferrumequinum TaxID=59479 RepID=A0A7J7YIN3_RHIFE|nr:hypothetical protein mRhiFer1_009937 [Rhinolophus ferrumequinum]